MPTNIETIISASTQGFVNALNQAASAVDKNTKEWAEEFKNINESAEIVKMSIDKAALPAYCLDTTPKTCLDTKFSVEIANTALDAIL